MARRPIAHRRATRRRLQPTTSTGRCDRQPRRRRSGEKSATSIGTRPAMTSMRERLCITTLLSSAMTAAVRMLVGAVGARMVTFPEVDDEAVGFGSGVDIPIYGRRTSREGTSRRRWHPSDDQVGQRRRNVSSYRWNRPVGQSGRSREGASNAEATRSVTVDLPPADRCSRRRCSCAGCRGSPFVSQRFQATATQGATSGGVAVQQEVTPVTT
jgi:hypothetical protein